MEREFRTTACELRADGDGRLRGHAAVFNVEANVGGAFLEEVKPGAFSRALRENQDVRCLFNHNADLVLGRTKAGTLSLVEDSIGLAFDCTPPPTQTARDVHASITRGDISQCSFGFIVRKQTWSKATDADGVAIDRRQLEDVDLFDISAVTFPAYSQTTVSARSVWPDGAPADVRLRVRTPARLTACYVARYAPVFGATAPLRQGDADPELDRERMRARVRLALMESAVD